MPKCCTSNFGVQTYPISNDRDIAPPTAQYRFVSLRGPPGRVPSACQPPQSSQTLTGSTNNTIVIQSELRGSDMSPSREPKHACQCSRSVHKRPACPCSSTATSPASRSSSSVRFCLVRTPPRASLETSLDDQLDPQYVRAAEAHGRQAAARTSTYDH